MAEITSLHPHYLGFVNWQNTEINLLTGFRDSKYRYVKRLLVGDVFVILNTDRKWTGLAFGVRWVVNINCELSRRRQFLVLLWGFGSLLLLLIQGMWLIHKCLTLLAFSPHFFFSLLFSWYELNGKADRSSSGQPNWRWRGYGATTGQGHL